jgi:transglutaminase-like putative cysteine protease
VNVVEAVKQANRPGAPEHSVLFRVAATGAVVTSIVACWAAGELSTAVTWTSIVLVIAGNTVSYRRRMRPIRFLKLVLAVAVVIAFVWFFLTVSARASAGDLASVEGPLAVLFTFIQVTHAFDVPSRRDLGFSLAGSATLMAVAAAQSVDDVYGLYVIVWGGFGLVGLLSMWGSQSGGARIRPFAAIATGLCVLAVAVLVVVSLPAPHTDSSFILPSSIAADLPLSQAASLVGGGPKGNEPVHAGTPHGRTGVGGYLGFAGPLDTAVRGSLGSQVVFRVRADKPTFWVAETFDKWTGQSWTAGPPPGKLSPWRPLNTQFPFLVPEPLGEPDRGAADYQTFYIVQPGPNLVFHAANAAEVWFPARHLYESPYGTLRSSTSMGPGSVYTVLSTVNTATPAELSGPPLHGIAATLSSDARDRFLQLPHPYPRVAALAQRITANAPTTYAKVLALEHWIGKHTRYTLTIPPLATGQDTVDQFLFVTRRGYCEQISTSLAVMLRTLGIPAREATGYVPGPYDPLTDLYTVQAQDAHAWVQVWFPGYGWQSFDPTADVPLANPSPASVLAHELRDELGKVPVVPVVAGTAVVVVTLLLVRRRRRRPATWGGRITAELVEAARRAGQEVGPGETLTTVAERLDALRPPTAAPPDPDFRRLATLAERAAYGDGEPDPTTKRALLRAARRLRRGARRLGRRAEGPGPGRLSPGGGPAPRRSSPRPPATVGTPSADGDG